MCTVPRMDVKLDILSTRMSYSVVFPHYLVCFLDLTKEDKALGPDQHPGVLKDVTGQVTIMLTYITTSCMYVLLT